MSSKEEKRKITRAAGHISIAVMISRVLGYIRDMLLAGVFGATGSTDAFYIAYRVPNLMRNLFAEGSISAAFIPVLTSYMSNEGVKEARILVRVVFTFMCILLLLICTLGIIFAPYIIYVIAPGFVDEPQKFELTVLLTRIMFPFLFFISIASLMMGVHNVLGSFFIPAVASALFNLSIIFSVLFLRHFFNIPLIAVALGVVLGGLAQLLIQLPLLLKNRFYPIPTLK
ncbi:MAG: murein biosynthesis integral membrane protein MurJ, partial [Nitrospirae bacterium]